ncbi:glycosyltransferase [Bacillus kexueae]|uniref:glycosyltransferase n=1 Tax=Aeribacillus kexueae TaxID=2078952 RepID=UPI001FAFE4AA
MKTIAHYLLEDIKVNQGFIYNQMNYQGNYRSIVFGPFDKPNNTDFPFEHFFNLNDIDSLTDFFQLENIIAIHAHHGKHAVEIAPIAIQCNVPLIVSIRGADGSTQSDKLMNRNMARYRSLIKHKTLFLPVCDFLRNELLKLGIPEEKVRVLYGGIDVNLFKYKERALPSEGDINLVSVGRLVEKKGHESLIKAMRHIHEKEPRVKLAIIGEGKERGKLETLIRDLQLEGVVSLEGKKTSLQIAEYLNSSHLFCLPSITASNGDVEGIPNALKEAMASGIPVISTNHGGIPELITHLESGYLVRENDVLEIVEGVSYFLNHQYRWKEISKNARHVIEEKFNLKKQLEVQHDLYRLLEELPLT